VVFLKKTQKTPQKYIERARKILEIHAARWDYEKIRLC
jgi:phage-related protein